MRQITLPILLLGLMLLENGCVSLPHQKPGRRPEPQAGAAATEPAPAQTPSPSPQKKRSLLSFFSLGWLFPHRQPPPRALALTRVGVIRTVAHDGGFVIIELEPGVMIPPGRELLVIPSEGAPIHLRAAENQPPYFIADVENGLPSPGQMVQQ